MAYIAVCRFVRLICLQLINISGCISVNKATHISIQHENVIWLNKNCSCCFLYIIRRQAIFSGFSIFFSFLNVFLQLVNLKKIKFGVRVPISTLLAFHHQQDVLRTAQFYTFLRPHKARNSESEIAVRLRKWEGNQQKTIAEPLKIFPLSFSLRVCVFLCYCNRFLVERKGFTLWNSR